MPIMQKQLSALTAIYEKTRRLPGFSYMAVREGFEPSNGFPLHTFQACAFSHSATSP